MIVVIGAMRTGTSAVAQMLNRMGVHMGASQAIPMPVIPHEDYEDLALSLLLAPFIEAPKSLPSESLRGYCEERAESYGAASQLFPSLVTYGVKSTLLPLFWKQWCEVAPRQTVIACVRDSQASDLSLQRCAESVAEPIREDWLSKMRWHQAELHQAMETVRPDHRIEFDARVRNPQVTREQLMAAIEEDTRCR